MTDVNIINPLFNGEKIDETFDMYFIKIFGDNQQLNPQARIIHLHERLRSLDLAISSKVTVYIERGYRVYFLIKKGLMTDEKIKKLEGGNGEIKLTVCDQLAQKYAESHNTVNRKILLQLLINMLPTIKDQTIYSNLDGELYMCHPKWKHANKVFALKIEIKNDMRIIMTATTFKKITSKDQAKGKTIYYWHDKFHYLRRLDNNASAASFYIRKGVEGKKAHIPYVSTETLFDYEASKVGLWSKLEHDINLYLNDYVTITLKTLEEIENIPTIKNYENENFLNKTTFLKDYAKFFEDKVIYLVDLVQNEDSREKAELFREGIYEEEYLQDILIKTSQRLMVGENVFNVVIIHEAAYYQKEETGPDQYITSENQIIQHITIKGFKKAGAIKVLQELIVKYDMYHRRLTDLTKKEYFIDKPMTFYKIDTLQKQDYLFILDISGDGELTFSKYLCDKKAINSNKRHHMIKEKAIRNISSKDYYENKMLYGGIYKNSQESILIKETGLFTFPNYKRIEAILKGVIVEENTQSIDRQTLLASINEFIGELEKKNEINSLKLFEEKIINLSSDYVNSDLKALGNLKSDGLKKFNQYFFDTQGIYIWSPIRAEKETTFSNQFGIHAVNKIGQDVGLFYYVGEKKTYNNREGYDRSTIIRKVVVANENSERLFEDMLPLFEVEFVKNASYTVYPFPFKYLNEYIWREQKKIEKNKK